MNVSEPFIRRPVMTTLAMVFIIFFGVLSYFSMPVSDLPNIEYPTIKVDTIYPGASPETMSNAVTFPLERQFSTIEKVRVISSQSITGQSTIVLMFDLDKPLDVAAQDVQAAINQAQANLPENLPQSPTYTKVNPSATPILVWSLSSNTMPRGKIYDYAYSLISNRISMVSGVAEVTIYGAPYAVRVQVNPEELAAKEIPLLDVSNTISSGNPDLPTGTLYGPKKEYTLNVDGQLLTAKGYNDLILKNDNGALLRIGDIGNAVDSLQNDKYSLKHYTKTETKEACVLAVLKQANANTIETIAEIEEIMVQLRKELPGSLELSSIFNQSTWIYESLNDVQLTLFIAFLLVILVTLFYLGKAIDTIIPVCVLPITVLGTFCLMYLFGFSLDILSLLSITLSIGFLIDDAIVVMENIVRHVEEGQDRMTAALEGSKQICFTVISTSVSLSAVFIPLLFMTGMIGRIFREFAATIFIAIYISSAIALTLTPLLCSRFIAERGAKKSNFIERFSNKINSFMLSGYDKSLKVVLRHKIMTILFSIGCIAASFALFEYLPKDFLPPDDLGFIQGFTITQDGTSPFSMMQTQEKIAKITNENPYVDMVVSVGAQPQDNQSIFYVKLIDSKKRPPIWDVMNELYAQYKDIIGANIFLKSFPLINLDIGTTTSSGAYQYILTSFDQDVLYKIAPGFIEKMKTLSGIKHVNTDLHINQPQINISIQRDLASSFNVTAEAIEQALMFAYGATRISLINSPINQYWVMLETNPSAYKDPTVLNYLYVRDIQNSTLVPLSEITKWEKGTGPLNVNHTNTMPSVMVMFDLEDVPLSTALENIQQASASLPKNVFGSMQGAALAFRRTFADLITLLFIAVFIIYVCLGILYENFLHPITVMSALPPAAISGLFTLLIFNEPISLYAFIGLIMLLGIVLKNGIIMIDFAIEAEQKGEKKSAEEAIYYAAITRFRPIIMTTFSTMMGALPIALGIGGLTAESRRPVGLVIVGGLILSQIITLYVTPVVYIYIERLRTLGRKKPKEAN